MPIGALNSGTPSGGDVAGTSGPAQLQDIKAQLRASFPAFVTGFDVVTLSAPEINEAARKNANQTISAVWNFTAAPTIGGNAIATQAWVSGARGYGTIRANGSTFTPAGGTQTVSLPSALGAEKNVTRSSTSVTVTAAGVYRVAWSFAGSNLGTTSSGSATVRVAVDGVGVTTLGIASIPTAPGEDYYVGSEGYISLAAGQVLSLQMTNFTTGGSVGHESFLSVERID